MRPRRSSPGDFWPETRGLLARERPRSRGVRGQGYLYGAWWAAVRPCDVHQITGWSAVLLPFPHVSLSSDEKAKPQMAGVTPSFQFQVPPASEDTKAPGLLASMAPGGFMDAQKEVSRPRWPIHLEPMPGACLRSSRAAVAAWRRCSCGRLSRRRMRALLASHTLAEPPSS